MVGLLLSHFLPKLCIRFPLLEVEPGRGSLDLASGKPLISRRLDILQDRLNPIGTRLDKLSLKRNRQEVKAVWNFIDRSWVQIKIAFDVRDGFQKSDKTFELPADIHSMSPDRKQLMTLCNLFANHGQSFEELAVYFGMDRNQVISVLMQEGLLNDQRRRAGERIRGGRRESDRAISQNTRREALQGLTQ